MARDGFDTIFGANADAARAGVDAALDGWEQVIANLNRPSAPGDNHLDITVTMELRRPGELRGRADGGFDGDGWPSGGDVNINGQANVWFIDPTPTESLGVHREHRQRLLGRCPGRKPGSGAL